MRRVRYFTHDIRFFTLSRFADAHVRREHQVATMLGARYGGFIFDTNAVHKIEYALLTIPCLVTRGMPSSPYLPW